VNPDVLDVYASEKNENTPKNTKNNNLLKTKRMLNIKMSAKGGAVFTFSLPGGEARSPAPVSYATAYHENALPAIHIKILYLTQADQIR